MKVYIKFIGSIYFKSLTFVFLISFSLVTILNLLTEIEFFKNEEVSISFTLFLSILNSPDLIFEMFPFILLITIQMLFVKLSENKELDIFKYSGLTNSKILLVISGISLITGILIIAVFYNISSNFKNIYLEIKSDYADDGKYLAVVTNNGLWIKDKIDNKTIITNSSEISGNYLLNNFITEFDENFQIIRNIKSEKIDISKNEWSIITPRIYVQNNYIEKKNLKIRTNFNQERIKTLYSNLSALNIYELYQLRKNYVNLNYSLIDIDLHILKLGSMPVLLLLISIFAALTMFKIKQLKSTTFKISLGLFCSVIIYYLNNFSFVLGKTEKIHLGFAVFFPIFILTIINFLMLNKINEK